MPHERAQVWQFLFGMYPSSSTALERPLIQEQMAARYQVMKKKWQHVFPGAVHLQLNGTDGTHSLFVLPIIIWILWSTLTLQIILVQTNEQYVCYQDVCIYCFWGFHLPLFLSFLPTIAELIAAVEFFHQRQKHIQKEASQLSEEVCERMSFLELQAQVKKTKKVWSQRSRICNIYKQKMFLFIGSWRNIVNWR